MDEKNITIILVSVIAVMGMIILFNTPTGMVYRDGYIVQHPPESGNCAELNNKCGTWQPLDNESRWCLSYNYNPNCPEII